MYVHSCGLIFLWVNILLHNLGQALKSCHTRSSRCTPGPPLDGSTKSSNSNYFRCPRRGHFPIADDTFTFYKCPGKDFLPCTCTCKNSQMCFDPFKKRCRFAFLDSVKNCTLYEKNNLDPHDKRGGLKPQDAESQRNGKHLKHRKTKPDINEVLKPSLPLVVAPGPIALNYSEEGLLTEPEVIAAQQSANQATNKIIEDNSRFPAWAISLLVLCVVLVLVFIVMVMY